MDFVIRSYRHGEEQFAANLHKRLYQEEYSWGPSFTDYAVKIALDFAAKPKSSKEDLFVADKNGTLIGCIMLCQTEDPEVGQLRLFAVEKEYRRYGVGKALMTALMEKAKSRISQAYPLDSESSDGSDSLLREGGVSCDGNRGKLVLEHERRNASGDQDGNGSGEPLR